MTPAADTSTATHSPSATVHALHAGHLTLPERFFVRPLENETARKTVPSLSFLIQHRSGSGKLTRIVFDLGVRRDVEMYAPKIRRHVQTRQPVGGMPDVVSSLAEGGLRPQDIDMIILSHVHWDHIGMPSDFVDATFVVGHGALALLNGETPLANGSHSHFEKDLLPRDRTIELHAPETSNFPSDVPTFQVTEEPFNIAVGLRSIPWLEHDILPHTLDIFGDGTVLIVSAPGHLPGHVNLLCRTEESKVIYLAGDSFHDSRLLTGEKDIATWTDPEFPGRICCIHADQEHAERTIEMIRRLDRGESALGPIEVIFAHDDVWQRNAVQHQRFFPNTI